MGFKRMIEREAIKKPYFKKKKNIRLKVKNGISI